MMRGLHGYFASLIDRFGRGWNRFWFTPSDPYALCVMRILTGLAALYCHVSHSADLIRWFGPQGLLPPDTVRFVASEGLQTSSRVDPSLLWFAESPAALWLVHGIGLVILLMFTVGWFTRVTSVLSLVVLLSYVHRAPMIAGHAEPVLTMLVAYLCLGPCGAYLSADCWWKRRRHGTVETGLGHAGGVPTSVAASISTRLIQLHTAAFYLMMGLTKLAGVTWWSGEAVWWLIAQAEMRLVDLTFLRDHIYVINAWTHAVVLFELSFSILVWNRTARPLLLGLAVPMWLSLASITGLVTFGVVMVIANCSFISPATWRSRTAIWGLGGGTSAQSLHL